LGKYKVWSFAQVREWRRRRQTSEDREGILMHICTHKLKKERDWCAITGRGKVSKFEKKMARGKRDKR